MKIQRIINILVCATLILIAVAFIRRDYKAEDIEDRIAYLESRPITRNYITVAKGVYLPTDQELKEITIDGQKYIYLEELPNG